MISATILIPPVIMKIIIRGATILSPNIGKAKLLIKYKIILINIDHVKYFFIVFTPFHFISLQ